MKDPLERELEIAGLNSEQIGRGGLPPRQARVPPFLKLEAATLRWRIVNDEDPSARGHDVDPAGMLNRFIKIRSGRDVLRFAETYGPLMLCEHGLPVSHEQGDACLPLGWLDQGGPDDPGEPLDRWHYYVSMARSILEVTTALHGSDDIPREALRRFIEGDHAERLTGRTKQDYMLTVNVRVKTALSDREHAKREVAWAVNAWLVLGNVRPELAWYEGQRFVQLGAATFGVLGIQLMNTVTAASSIAPCSHCGDLVPRARKPQRRRRVYCDKAECKKWGARERQRKKQGKGDAPND